MTMRALRTAVALAMIVAGLSGTAALAAPAGPERSLYGVIGSMKAVPGQRDALAAILAAGTTDMPGCLSYVVALDKADPDLIWISEVWDSRESHAASLTLPSVREAIRRGRPLIAGFGSRVETVPVGGVR
jgi:quinol monooxygenase YgiN